MILEVFRIRNFLFLWLAQIFSQIATNMMHFVLILRAFQLTNSNTAVSGIVLAFNLPAAIFGILAGAFVDRRDKRQILLVSNIARSMILIPLLFAPKSLPLIYIVALLVSAATQFFIPAEAPMIPKLVPRKLLVSANALFTVSLYSSIVLGFVLAGPALRLFGQTYVFLFLCLLFLVASIFISCIPVSQQVGRHIASVFINLATRQKTAKTYIFALSSDLSEAYRMLQRGKEVVASLFLLSLSQVVILMLGALLPGYAKTVLNIEGEDLSLFIFAPAAFGVVLGAILVGQIGARVRTALLINLGTLASGILIFLLPFSNRFASQFLVIRLNNILPSVLEIDVLNIVIVIAVLLGFFNALVTVSANVILQGETHKRIHGRIYGAFVSLSAILALVPVILAGGLADFFGVGRVLSAVGIFIILLGLYRLLTSKYTHLT